MTLPAMLLVLACAALLAGEEGDSYRIVTPEVPPGVVLEVGGIALREDGSALVCTRRGQVFVLENPEFGAGELLELRLFADGLHEPLGLLVHEGAVYCAQRGELSRLVDQDGDDRVDRIETVCDEWRISGNYHEYNFGPRLDRDGNFWITTNKPFGDEPFGKVAWRGFALRVRPDGTLEPVCSGLRSPAGLQQSPGGDLFYTDNQGEWCGASKLSLLEPGSFHGHPHGIDSCEDPLWRFPRPVEPTDGILMPDETAENPTFRLPAVWFPYDKMGRSPAGFAWDLTSGAFGPFAGQVFVADQYDAAVFRVFLEQVNGRWQGACFPFRHGFQSGIVRVAFTPSGNLLAGMTDRGWGSLGNQTEGLQRLEFTGTIPFEIHEMRAAPRGFVLTFTWPLDRESAANPASYAMTSYTYRLHSAYGSPEVETATLPITAAAVATDALSVALTVEGLREGFVHELHLPGVRSAGGEPLLHDVAYYTLIERPQ